MPFWTPDPIVSDFVTFMYSNDLVINFDWSAWDEGREWYKNDESQHQYFAVSYQTVDEETKLTKLLNFYPDYIVRYSDGSIGI